MTRPMRLGALAAAVALAASSGSGRLAQAAESIRVSVGVRPAVVTLGELAEYRGRVVVPKGTAVRWLSPETSEPLTWGPRSASRRGARGMDTVFVSIPLQAFELGALSVPGLRFELQPPGGAPTIQRLPLATLRVVSVLTAADSAGNYRELHGPLAAPWWERVPWLWVTIAGVLLAVLIAWIVWLRRRKKAGPEPVVAPKAVARDPGIEALSALAALRLRQLPLHGRFADHAFELGQILRRFLEATTASRPGQTTPELVGHLRDAGLGPEEVQRLGALLTVWDRVKFARAPLTVEDAVRTENAVEAFVRRPATRPETKVA